MHYAMKTYMWEWRYSPDILNLGTGWSWMVSFTRLPLHLWRKSLLYTLDSRLVGPQSWSERCGEKKYCRAGNGTRVVQPVAIPSLFYVLYSYISMAFSCRLVCMTIRWALERSVPWKGDVLTLGNTELTFCDDTRLVQQYFSDSQTVRELHG
jgi:hypothetical protein